MALRLIGCALIILPIFYLLRQHLAEMDAAQLAVSLRSIPLQSLAIAGFFTFISLMAVARYDVLASRQLGLNLPDKTATHGGFVAVSLGQTLGFGLIVGAICRWRLYRGHGVSVAQAGLMSGIVTIGFLAGFAVVLSVAVLIAPEGLMTVTGLSAGALRSVACLGLGVTAAVLIASILKPVVQVGGRQITMPKVRVLRAQIILAALDTIPAAVALWVLIPSEIAPGLFHVIPVYLAALGLGLVSNTPGGLGVLELTCLVALPVLPPEALLAALIAYRGIYYGIPAVLAVVLLVAKEFSIKRATRDISDASAKPDLDIALARSSRADAQLAVLGDKSFVFSDCCTGFIMFSAQGNSLIALSDPVGPSDLWPELLDKFEVEAKRQMLAPSFYKCSKEFNAYVAERGWFTCQIASEAVIDLETYSTTGSTKRELRRKLKSAAGLELVCHAPGAAPLHRFASVNAVWAKAKGGERGFSMGYFKPDYMSRFHAIEARTDGKTVGFLSLWISGDGTEIGLDVMRLTDEALPGTMHALVHEAADWGRARGATRFSLSAVPFMLSEEPNGRIETWIQRFYEDKPDLHGAHGLFRFKNAFRPRWEPHYGAAPRLSSAMVAAADVTRLINTPVDQKSGNVTKPQEAFDGDLVAA